MSHGLPDFLVDYLVQRDNQRAQAVDDFLDKLTKRERALIMQIAVMGYVQGVRHPEGERIPSNGPLLAQVIDACFAFPDTYPTVTGIAHGNSEPVTRVEWFVEREHPEGSWSQCSNTTTDPEQASIWLGAHQKAMDFEFRVSRRVTSTVTEVSVTEILPPDEEGE